VKADRPKLPRRIVESPGILNQLHLATYGRRLSLLEELTGKYLTVQWPGKAQIMEWVLSPKIMEATRESTAQGLCAEFLRVIEARDWNTLTRLAAIGPKLLEPGGDPTSAGILVWKLTGQLTQAKPSFDWEIAKAIGYTGNAQVFARRLRALGCPYKVHPGGRGHKRPDTILKMKAMKS
jgi:hypothetical protein